MLHLNHNDNKPIYQQIKHQIKHLILKDALKPDMKLPSVRELSAHLAINPNTIQRAYRELESEGYIYTIRAKGNFVAKIDNSTLKKHCDNLFYSLDKTLIELKNSGIGIDEIILRVNELYNKGGKNDD